MIAVIFELEPETDKQEQYFEIAGQLKTLLTDIDGFISIERFQSLANKNRFLSLSFWENEHSVKLWRNQICHRDAQAKGRDSIFKALL